MAVQKEQSKFSKKIDTICRALFLTEEGKPKSAAFLYSFCLAVLFFGIYLGADVACVAFLNEKFPEPTTWVNILQFALPGVAAAAVCVCFTFFFRTIENKKIVPSAFAWLCALTLGAMIIMIFLCDPADSLLEYRLFMYIVIGPILVFLVAGTLGSQLLVRKYMAEEAQRKQNMPKRASYYNT